MGSRRYDIPGVIKIRRHGDTVYIRKDYDGSFIGEDNYYNLLTLTRSEASEVSEKLWQVSRRATDGGSTT